MPMDDILMDCEMNMEKALDHLKHELRGIRTGRASPALVENVRVDYYGSQTEIRAIASITIPQSSQLMIKPFNSQDLKAIERAISDAKLPLTPHSDGKALRLMLPPMSQDVRMKMVGQCKGIAETAKITIRNARRDANKLVETEQKGGIITEDDAKRGKDEIQELTKNYEGKVDATIEEKKKEIMEI